MPACWTRSRRGSRPQVAAWWRSMPRPKACRWRSRRPRRCVRRWTSGCPTKSARRCASRCPPRWECRWRWRRARSSWARCSSRSVRMRCGRRMRCCSTASPSGCPRREAARSPWSGAPTGAVPPASTCAWACGARGPSATRGGSGCRSRCAPGCGWKWSKRPTWRPGGEAAEMQMRTTILARMLAMALAGQALPATAAAQGAQAPTIRVAPTDGSADGAAADRCLDGDCGDVDPLLFRVQSRGERDAIREFSEAERSVRLRLEQEAGPAPTPGVARIRGQFRIDLPGGGMAWATEDPQHGVPVMNVRAPATVALRDGRFDEPVRFSAYANHAAFIERMEVRVFAGSDTDLVRPLAVVGLPVGNLVRHEWDGAELAGNLRLRTGDSLLYVARAYDKDGHFDETLPQSLQLVTPEEQRRGNARLRDEVSRVLGEAVEVERAQRLQVEDAIYGRSALRV